MLQKISFSVVQDEHLLNMGIKKGRLYLKDSPPSLAANSPHIDHLCEQIDRIFRYVSMKVGAVLVHLELMESLKAISLERSGLQNDPTYRPSYRC